MNVSDGQFFMARLPDSDSVHDERDEAIDHLRAHANGIDPESDDVAVIEVTVDGGDWAIKEISGMQIAMELLSDGGEA